jgi:CRISPR-associated endonuclease/helicase Cas3
VRKEYENLFNSATGHDPYSYQTALAEASDWPEVIHVETGLGKTNAVIVGWLYKRRYASSEIRAITPRRLIICLPTRVLVEQTYRSCQAILDRLKLEVADTNASVKIEDGVYLKILWGGDVDNDIDRHPEMDMILIGTQDMLLSRALNRGYAMSKFRWPAHYAILNNDCLWVMDEIQLMGVGAATSAQLEAFRSSMGTFWPHRTVWMSATVDTNCINTVDHPAVEGKLRDIKLSPDDLSNERIRSIIRARKLVKVSPLKSVKDDKKSNMPLAARINAVHEKGTMTLVILNTVSRAMAAFNDLEKADLGTPVILLHSHFRPNDRKAQYDCIRDVGDMIVISTQVVEAGADISAKNLITDLAPWPSMVQRFGRCNRRGEYDEAMIEWIDLGETIDQNLALPYEADDLIASRRLMIPLEDGSPESLSKVKYTPDARVVPVIRRKDALDLFDTTPDLMGNDLDVSKFIRSNDSTDVFVYWREIEDSPSEGTSPSNNELCSVPIGEIGKYLEKNNAWTWNYVDGDWDRLSRAEARSLRPGSVLLLDPAKGGYSSTKGWTGSEKDIPRVIVEDGLSKGDSQDTETHPGKNWVSLADHTDDVVKEVGNLEGICPAEYREIMVDAARWHDVGKAHEAFQSIFQTDEAPCVGTWGKGLRRANGQYCTVDKGGQIRYRRYFRHELASALAYMSDAGRSPTADLTKYLIAAHHGKVRTSLRSVPSERGPDRDTLFARGIWDGDIIHYPEGLKNDIVLDLSPVRMGASSWTNMVLSLRDDPNLGPFRLSYLETLLRVADWRASGKEERDAR